MIFTTEKIKNYLSVNNDPVKYIINPVTSVQSKKMFNCKQAIIKGNMELKKMDIIDSCIIQKVCDE